ncbi:MAG: DUF3536 domain-containing protein [Gemmatimonadetes bacterium]|nr:DUF3536 domain-containing protein [Gemmatimonadota bacterium]
MSSAAVVIHGHFYQPPREDPWTGEIPLQPSAAPFGNWNVRIAEECYAPLAELGAFDWLSFDIGPTLARWLARERPEVHEAIIAGDWAGRARLGHGNAIAQPYHHIILPLATEAEKASEIRGGLQDFERRFGRPADGMWLPETAVDRASLEALAAAGVGFTILAPHQVDEIPIGGIGRVDLEGGRSIAVCIYDGELSHGVAFGELLEGDHAWFDRIELAQAAGAPLIALAMDGETFGHHHEGADQTLVEVVEGLRASPHHRVENVASVLSAGGTLPRVDLVEPTSWSCSHGVERWRSDCGCKMIPERASQQGWRAPLRAALETLRDSLEEEWRELGPAHLLDPDDARRGLGTVLGGPDSELIEYARTAAALTSDSAIALLEIARDTGAMFTSCGWFFDDVTGLEAGQVLRYAAHALDRLATLRPERAAELERALVATLGEARSNDDDVRDAARLYTGEIRGGDAPEDRSSPPLASPPGVETRPT